MRVVVSSNSNAGLDSEVSHHFGRCPYFTVVDEEKGKVTSVKVVENPFYNSHVPGQVPMFVKKLCADVMLAGGMGRRAISMFQNYGIECCTGAGGRVTDALEDYLSGTLGNSAPCAESTRHAGECGSDHEDSKKRRLRDQAEALLKEVDNVIVRLPDDDGDE
jgi:predicted Fe-Mo cluster-binding NifX family protein